MILTTSQPSIEIEEREAPLYKKWIFDYVSNFKKKKPSFH
jgi:hypothetical protein